MAGIELDGAVVRTTAIDIVHSNGRGSTVTLIDHTERSSAYPASMLLQMIEESEAGTGA